jgi:hypothetical protein
MEFVFQNKTLLYCGILSTVDRSAVNDALSLEAGINRFGVPLDILQGLVWESCNNAFQ